MDAEMELKLKIQSTNILEVSKETRISRSVIYNFLHGKSMNSHNLFSLLRYFDKKDIKRDPSKEDRFQNLLKLIVKIMNPRQIILFGSQARGDWKTDSDFDICILDPEENRETHTLKSTAYENKINLKFDYFVLSKQSLFNEDALIKEKIIKDGIVVYDRR